MSKDELDLAAVRRMASGIGLDRLTDEHLEALLRATRAARARRDALPVSQLEPSDEPAHVFHAGGEGAR